jgi:HAD superfamily hydrolase (TIGR01509 family)
MLGNGLIPLRPGIKQLISEAHQAGITLAIATTTSPENVTALLEKNLGENWNDFFASIGCGDIVPLKKPAPDIYHWVLDELHIPAANCIALEDTHNGLQSAQGAGIKTYITTNAYTHTQDFTGAAAVFEDLSDLTNFYRLADLKLA